MFYCERTGPGLFDEPVNAVTNAAFFVAAWGAWSLAKHRRVLSAELWVMIGLSVAVGVGSTLWHTFASPWAQPLDVVPILLFQLCFIWVYGRRQVGLGRAVVALAVVLYVGAALLGRQHWEWMNGVLIYAPALLLSLAVGLYHWRVGKREPFVLLAGAGFFCLALFFRTIDLWVCPCWPLGTHFLWHVFNGVVVYLAMRSLILNTPSLSSLGPIGDSDVG
jgi:hypothetical protein